jgi:ABC-type antimicrobial peptide transport system permease subunit
MAVFERVREIGILTAIGMGRGRLVAMIVLESQLVTLLGLSLGFAIAFVGVALLHDGLDLSAFAEGLGSLGIGTRIVPVVRGSDVVIPTLVAIATALASSVWPALRAVGLKPAEALRRV